MDEETRIVTSAVVETQPLKMRNSNFEIRTSEFLHVASLQRHGEQVRVQNKANSRVPEMHLTSVQKTGYEKEFVKRGMRKQSQFGKRVSSWEFHVSSRRGRASGPPASHFTLQTSKSQRAKQSQFAERRNARNICAKKGLCRRSVEGGSVKTKPIGGSRLSLRRGPAAPSSCRSAACSDAPGRYLRGFP